MMTMDERDTSAEPEVQDMPKIGEKVRFWEEQDRINQELIPRVIKQHELFTTHVQGHEDVQVHMAALDARISEALDEAVKQAVADSDKKIAALEARVSEAAEEARKQAIQESHNNMLELEERTTLEVKSAKRQMQIISGVSLAVAVVSIILALVS